MIRGKLIPELLQIVAEYVEGKEEGYKLDRWHPSTAYPFSGTIYTPRGSIAHIKVHDGIILSVVSTLRYPTEPTVIIDFHSPDAFDKLDAVLERFRI